VLTVVLLEVLPELVDSTPPLVSAAAVVLLGPLSLVGEPSPLLVTPVSVPVGVEHSPATHMDAGPTSSAHSASAVHCVALVSTSSEHAVDPGRRMPRPARSPERCFTVFRIAG